MSGPDHAACMTTAPLPALATHEGQRPEWPTVVRDARSSRPSQGERVSHLWQIVESKSKVREDAPLVGSRLSVGATRG
jgi:hypothetical protein